MQTRRHFLVPVAALVAGLWAPALAHAKPVLPAPAMAELERYDVLGYSDPHNNGVERGKAIGLFDATPDEVYRVATDYSRWGEFMPKIKRSEIVAFSGADCNVALTAELKFLGENWVEAKYHHQQHGDTYRVDFAMERGQLKQYLGSILVEPYRKADGSLKSTVTFEVVAEPNGFAPRSILNRAIKRIAVNSVHALRQRVNDLHAAGLLHPNRPAQPLQPIAAQPQRPQAKK